MPLKAVLFDMDGVIVDTEPLHRKAYFQMFETFGANVSDELYAQFAGASTKKVCQTVIERFRLDHTFEELQNVKRGYFKEMFYHDADFDLIPGVRKLIEHYHENGVKLVLASSASPVTIEMVFEKFGLDPYFVGKISGAELKESKPHPEIFLMAAEISGEPKENCMVIEDSSNGILAAHRAGIFCSGFKSEHTHGQDYTLANLVVNDFKDLELDKMKIHF
ncbi:HAD family hydrolase [Moheibacter lacus]|uniref:HAD family phosphatase n=1 Tax=Moheibacter lacus TaxID=2745851 RepID=A0A838ZU66_9FLAO|nr:HAD family phosphatase [Moheibacter lacus]MBA5630502.1 HAD family phosphatase [Moheibacter lacus]